ncbi:hypothetical protein WUBG_04911 [Wuchereria bancrofti]|uniref:Uncharacterized protein n=1 Tax=Wuchereria bancrofti TaxID=6293 RepID=J9BAP0_WUCBA|nr:hypothetical protein WUBG_04911 [Wuchereria bancrofti]
MKVKQSTLLIQTANGDEQNEIYGSAGRVKETSKEQKKKEIDDQILTIKKQEEDISEKKKIKGLNESVMYLAMDQSCAEEGKEFKTEKIMDHITLSSGKIPKHSETSETEMIMKRSISEELDINTGKLAQQYSEPLGGPNLSLSGNVSGSMTATSCAKEAEYDMDVEKQSVVLLSQMDEVNRVLPVRDRICKLLPRDIQFCVHMIEKHGENYEAMEKDQGNIFRDSAKGIARKIRIFKESPQYEAYLKKKTESFGSVA